MILPRTSRSWTATTKTTTATYDDDYDHDVLLVAGSRPEVARLAPVARAFESVGRIRAITVATGCRPDGECTRRSRRWECRPT